MSRPKLSVVVVVYDMARETPKTLSSLAKNYQVGIDEEDYEVIVVDNGSPTPLGEALVRKFGRQFRYYYIEDASPSPASAVNFGVQRCRGKLLNIMIDGARMVTPGLLRNNLLAFKAYDDPTVMTLGWHLGPDRQQKSIQNGYSKAVEDDLLKGIDWPRQGYSLYKVASLGGSSRDGCFSTVAESNTIGISRRAFEELKGFDTAFALPGGGLVNLDFYKRASERPNTELVCLVGEGSFHQLHGGASTGITQAQLDGKFKEWSEDYRRIRGTPWQSPKRPTAYLGPINKEVLPHLAWSANHRLEILAAAAKQEPPAAS
jgi:glycosyltransferase involved in cell wall biosynthesis